MWRIFKCNQVTTVNCYVSGRYQIWSYLQHKVVIGQPTFSYWARKPQWTVVGTLCTGIYAILSYLKSLENNLPFHIWRHSNREHKIPSSKPMLGVLQSRQVIFSHYFISQEQNNPAMNTRQVRIIRNFKMEYHASSDWTNNFLALTLHFIHVIHVSMFHSISAADYRAISKWTHSL